MRSRPGLIRLAAVAAIVAAGLGGAGALADDRPMNVLLITSDDLGLQPSCYGGTVIATPELDALAAEGVRFEVAYVAQASCSPSRSAMFTGTFPHTNGQYGLVNGGFSLHPEFRDRTLPNMLKRAGYRTGIIGKLHVAPESTFQFDERPRVNTRDVASVAKAAGSFLESTGDGPFFLMVNYSDPHAARVSRQSNEWYFQAQVEGLPADPIPARRRAGLRLPGDRRPGAVGADGQLLQLRQAAGRGRRDAARPPGGAGHADDTLVIFIGDHGPPFARGKTTCYESGLRVPFLVRWPGVSKPMASPKMVATVDIVPTVLDAAGLEDPRLRPGPVAPADPGRPRRPLARVPRRRVPLPRRPPLLPPPGDPRRPLSAHP